MKLGNPFCDREAEAGPAHFPRSRFVNAVEPIENLVEVLFRNADAAVLNLNQRGAVVSLNGERNMSAIRCVLNRVIDQIQKQLSQPASVSHNRHRVGFPQLDFNMFRFREHLAVIVQIANERIEMDFFNGNTSGAFGSFPPRLRFAWADFGPFLIGQAAYVFMDYDVFPNVLDYEGPPDMVLMRQVIASVHWNPSDCVKISVGVEQMYTDMQWNTTNDLANPAN